MGTAAGVGKDGGKLTMPGLISSVIPIRMGFPGDGADAMGSGGGWTCREGRSCASCLRLWQVAGDLDAVVA